jgi:hypothetical protein
MQHQKTIKETNATKKYYLLQHQNKATATELVGTLATVMSLRSKSREEKERRRRRRAQI